MKVVTVLSTMPGTGKTTIAVNLAAGLSQQGNKILLFSPLNDLITAGWLQLISTSTTVQKTLSRFAFDILLTDDDLDLSPYLSSKDYDYLLIDTNNKFSSNKPAIINSDLLLCCIQAGKEDLSKIKELEENIHSITGGKQGIDIIIPCKARTSEWNNNTRQFMELAEQFGEKRLADMLPFCEAIHDLPQEKKSVWDLPSYYSNRKAAFRQLLRLVITNLK
jgi:cellulose biosynthesis protein BcsQ